MEHTETMMVSFRDRPPKSLLKTNFCFPQPNPGYCQPYERPRNWLPTMIRLTTSICRFWAWKISPTWPPECCWAMIRRLSRRVVWSVPNHCPVPVLSECSPISCVCAAKRTPSTSRHRAGQTTSCCSSTHSTPASTRIVTGTAQPNRWISRACWRIWTRHRKEPSSCYTPSLTTRLFI